jgi:hypothetical protein
VIDGIHLLLFTSDPDADQAVLRTILGTDHVEAGNDRIIIGLPPGEIATHATAHDFAHRHSGHDLQGLVLYLMCDDLDETVERLEGSGVSCTEKEEESFGMKTTIRLPSGAEVGLYQPYHERPQAAEGPGPRFTP